MLCVVLCRGGLLCVAVGCPLLFVIRWLFDVCCSLFVLCCLLFGICCCCVGVRVVLIVVSCVRLSDLRGCLMFVVC